MQNLKNDNVVYHVSEVSTFTTNSKECFLFFCTKTNISLALESLGVITAIFHALFEIPRKRQFIFIVHTTTQTSVVGCAKYFVTYTHSKMKNIK